VGRAQRYGTRGHIFRARLTGFYHRVGAPTTPMCRAPALRFAPPRCPKPLSGPTPRSLRTIPDDEGVRMSGWPPHRGGAQPSFGCGRLHNYYQRRIKRILRTSPFGDSANFAFKEFSEACLLYVLRTSPLRSSPKFDYRWRRGPRNPRSRYLKNSWRVSRRCLWILQHPPKRLDHPRIELTVRLTFQLRKSFRR
jgi:hypothetical protein